MLPARTDAEYDAYRAGQLHFETMEFYTESVGGADRWREIILASRAGARGHWLNVMATAYWPFDSTCTGTGLAADGEPAIPYRTLAVDPRVIPLGSRVYVPALKRWFVAHDTGGAIKGLRVDICMTDDDECFSWGWRPIQVYVVPPG